MGITGDYHAYEKQVSKDVAEMDRSVDSDYWILGEDPRRPLVECANQAEEDTNVAWEIYYQLVFAAYGPEKEKEMEVKNWVSGIR